MKLNPPATLKAIGQFEEEHDIMFPAHYRKFLRLADGGDVLGAEFYTLEALEKANSAAQRTFYAMPDSIYIVGKDGGGNALCVDLDTDEFLGWDHENVEDRAMSRYATVFEWIDDDFEIWQEVQAEYEEEDEEEPAADADDDCGITELFFNDEDLFIAFNKGVVAGQMIYMDGWILDNGCFRPSVGDAKQIKPISRDAIPSWEELEFIREIPFKERVEIRHMLELYIEKNPGVIELVTV